MVFVGLKRALHYPFNWIRFLEINKLCNVIAKNLTFSANRKLISISWKVWTCSNFSTNWKWKWMNRIRHGRKNVVRKQKFEWIRSVRMLLKWHVRKRGFQRLRDLLNSGMKKKVFGTFYRTTVRSGKKRNKLWKNVEKARNDK